MAGKRILRYFFVNLLCILLPLIVVSIFVTQKLVVSMQQEESEKISNQMEAVASALETHFQDFKVKSVALFENREFSSSHVVLDSNEAIEALALLKSLKQFDSMADDIVLYYGTGYLYHSAGRVRIDTYLSSTMGCDRESVEAGMNIMASEQDEVQLLYKQGGSGYLMYHIPVGKDYLDYTRSTGIYISFDRLGNLLNSCIKSTNVMLELEIAGKKVYFHCTSKGCKFVNEAEAAELLGTYKNEFLENNVTDFDMQIRFLFDMKQQLAEFYAVRNLCIGLMVVGVLLSFLMSFWMSKNRHSQVEFLINSIRKKKVTKDQRRSRLKNELDYIQSVVEEAILENQEVKTSARKYKSMLFSQISTMIFHGLLREREEIQTVLKICGTELFEEYFFICAVRVNSQEQLTQLEELLQADIHMVCQEKTATWVLILCELPCTDDSMEKRYEVTGRFRKVLESIDIQCGAMVASQVYDRISMVNYGYLQVLSIVRNLQDGFEEEICWEEWVQNAEIGVTEYYSEDLRAFHEAVVQKNEQQASLLLKRIMKQNVSGKNTDEMRYQRHVLLQELMLELRTSEKIEENQALLADITAIDVDNVASFEVQVRHVLKEYCSQKESSEDTNDILRFVEENYLECDFSLEKVAEYAGISKGQMSKLFRAKTGLSYIDYITYLRMEKAKELLSQTDRSIKDIFMAVGYMDVTGASRKFKAYYGMNPSVYREQVKEGKK